jgi:hypothetical protein
VAEITPDPHGIIETFATRLNANLGLMDPEMAAREAMAVVDAYLKGSKFIDMSFKGSEQRQYVRVDRRPEEVRR